MGKRLVPRNALSSPRGIQAGIWVQRRTIGRRRDSAATSGPRVGVALVVAFGVGERYRAEQVGGVVDDSAQP